MLDKGIEFTDLGVQVSTTNSNSLSSKLNPLATNFTIAHLKPLCFKNHEFVKRMHNDVTISTAESVKFQHLTHSNSIKTSYDINSAADTSTIEVKNYPAFSGINTIGMGTFHQLMYAFMAFSLVLSCYVAYAVAISKIDIHDSLLPTENPSVILKEIRIKNVNKVIIGTLNINSLSSKFEQLKIIIGNFLDILIIQETKLDPSFPTEQFLINGYKIPYRLDRNRRGGGVIIYIREDIPSKQLFKHKFTKNIEGLFIEVNLRKTKLLLFGTYHSTHPEYGLSDADYFNQIGFALDTYSNYEKFLLAGDFNIEEEHHILKDFLFEYNSKSLIKENTCFKSIDNPSCIDLFLTNSPYNFQNTTAVATGLSDFHKMVITVMKTTFPKAKPKVIYYRQYKKFVLGDFRMALKTRLENTTDCNIIDTYSKFEEAFLETINKHAPLKKKTLRANEKPFMTKALRKAIMRRSALQNRYYKDRLPESQNAFKKQRNYTNRLLKKEKKKYFANIDMKNYTDNKKFWHTVKPLFSNYNGGSQKITLIEKGEIISNDENIANTFNNFFIDSVKNLDIDTNENTYWYDLDNKSNNPVQIALNKYKYHPSICEIKQKVTVETKFLFSKVGSNEIVEEIQRLDINKTGTFSNITAKQLKQVEVIIAEPLQLIWNLEIIDNQKFPSKLKCADISPIFKKLDCVLKENYRPISILPVVSKIFERIMEQQIKYFIEKQLSPFLCGFRKGYNTQYALTTMIEKWKRELDKKGGIAGAILMDLSKAFDTINHELLIAKLEAYGFDQSALAILLSYLRERWHRTKINTTFSTWLEILSGVPQGSILGPILFNIYINDLFFEFENTHACNFADDTTLSAFGTNIKDVLFALEYDTQSAIIWFKNNFMKLNQDKCHFLISGNIKEHLWSKVGNELIWESVEENLLGVTIDKDLNFNSHLAKLCKKVGQKVTALARIVMILPFNKRRIILKTFIESQFSYCPLIWMFCSRQMNRKINHVHERALRLVYRDFNSTFEELLNKDKSVCIHHRNIHQVAIEMYKVKNNLSPPLMRELFKYNTYGHNTRMGDKFLRPNVNKVYKGVNSLRNFGPIVWNTMLPNTIKQCTSLLAFKNSIKSWIPNNCPCRLCTYYIKDLGFTQVYE